MAPTRPAGYIAPLLSILLFVVVQTVFFWLIGCKEVLHVVAGKAKSLSQARRILRRTGREFQKRTLDTAILEAERKALEDGWDPEAERKERDRANIALLMRWMLPWVVVTLGLLVLCILVLYILHRRGRSLNLDRPFWVGIALIVLAYVGEVLLFFLVIQRYVIFGDFELVRLMMGVTPKGTGYGYDADP